MAFPGCCLIVVASQFRSVCSFFEKNVCVFCFRIFFMILLFVIVLFIYIATISCYIDYGNRMGIPSRTVTHCAPPSLPEVPTSKTPLKFDTYQERYKPKIDEVVSLSLSKVIM